MVKGKDELLNQIKEIVGDNTDDSTLNFLTDITDTIDDYETRVNDQTDWKSKYEQNDAEWRQKYKDRFFNKGDDNDPSPPNPDSEPEPITRFDQLFKFG